MRTKEVIEELKEHTPFTALAVLVAILIVFFIYYILRREIGEDVFHIFHFLHIIVSAMATGALYYKYKPSFINAFFVGISGAIIIGSLSDVVFPYLGGIFLDVHLHFHLPLVEETFLTLFFASLGSIAGIALKITKTPHFAHVLLSVFASLFYLLAFSSDFILAHALISFFIVFVAVIVPCCLSDIVFPLIFIKKRRNVRQ